MEIKLSPLEVISLRQLVREAIQMYEIIIKLVNTDKQLLGLLSNSIIPFLAFIVDGMIKFFPDDVDYSENNLSLENDKFKKFVVKIRVGHKLYNDKRYTKKLRMMREIQSNNIEFLTSNYNCLQQEVIEIIGQKDYGTFSYDGIDYFNNMQGYIYLAYLFENTSKIKYKEGRQYYNDTIRNISSSLTVVLKSSVEGFVNAWGLIIDKESKINIDSRRFSTEDSFLIDSTRKDIFNDMLPSEVQILLHSNLCQMNFVSVILPDVLENRADLYIRFMIITYLEAIKSLDIIVKENESLQDITGIKISEVLNNKIYKLLSKGNIRNNVAHYNIRGYSITNLEDRVDTDNLLMKIIELETGADFYTFWKDFLFQFEQLKQLIESLIFSS